MENVKWRSLCQ